MMQHTPLGKENAIQTPKLQSQVKPTPLKSTLLKPTPLKSKTPFKTPLREKTFLAEKTNGNTPLLKTVLKKKKKLAVVEEDEIEYCPPPAIPKPWEPDEEHRFTLKEFKFPRYTSITQKDRDELQKLLNEPPEYDLRVFGITSLLDDDLEFKEESVDLDLTVSLIL